MSRLPAINREAWRIKGATGLQYQHIERLWQDDRQLPDRSGSGKGYSENPCPLARLRLGRAPPKTPPPPPDLPIGAPEVIRKYREEFDKRDYQGAGEVSTRELQELMRAIGRDLSEAAINILVQQIDKDGSGSVNFTEWLEGIFGIREPRPTDKPALKPMEVVFKDMREAIDRDDIKAMQKLIAVCERENFPPVLRAYKEPESGLGIIHVAARSGSDRMVLLMIEHRADPNEVCRAQETPLHFAAQSTGKYRDRMVSALLAAGAKRMAQTSSGYTAIHYMSSEYKLSGFDWKDDPSIRERFRHHRQKHHYAHGYHPMIAIADIVGADRKSHRQRDNLEEASERKPGKSHRSRRSSKSRAKTTDEVGLVVLPEDDDDDMQRLNTRGTIMWASPSLPCLRSPSLGSYSYLLYAGYDTASITHQARFAFLFVTVQLLLLAPFNAAGSSFLTRAILTGRRQRKHPKILTWTGYNNRDCASKSEQRACMRPGIAMMRADLQ